MFQKQISFALLLSYVFVLGNSQVIPNATRIALVTKNLCSDLTYGIGYYCLNDKQTYVLGFKSLETCEKLRDELNQLPKESASIGVNDCLARNELQALLNLETLTQVCESDGVEEVIYQLERDLCAIDPATGRGCYRLECLMNYHICDNITEVEEVLKLELDNEDQKYIVLFNRTTSGRRQCSKAVNKLNKLPKELRQLNITATLHKWNCTDSEKFLSCILNLEGLKWVCSRNQVERVTFEEKHFNESVCRNITRAGHFFFPGGKEVERFRVSYLTSDSDDKDKDKDNCSKIVEGLGKPESSSISAVVTVDNCNATSVQFQGEMNFEALKFVCNCTDPREVNVVQERETVEVGPIIG